MDVRKCFLMLFGALFLVSTVLVGQSNAGVDINIGINAPMLPPPAYVVPASPPVVVIPGTYVYYVPGIDVDILFYHGYWYRPYEGRWFRARSYNGPWGHIGPGAVPRPLVVLPPGYKRIPPGHERIPYGQLKKNWAKWERDRHWERARYEGRGQEEKGRGYEEKGRGHDDDRDRGHGGPRGR